MHANARLELDWGVATTHTVVWPTGPLDTERLARACAEVAASSESGSFVDRRLAATAAAAGTTPWRLLDRHRERFVKAAGHRSVETLVADLGRGVRDELLPFSFVVCPGGFAMVHSHELGDGSVSAALLEAVLGAYADDGSVRDVPDAIARDRDLVRALASVWRRRPGAVLEAGAGVLRRYRHRPVPVPVSGARAGASVRYELWAVTESDVDALDAWRRAAPARPSMSVALLWTVGRALAAHGYPSRPQNWQVVVGMRGPAPVLADFGGNLVGRALVEVDPDGDPSLPAGQLRRQSTSGEIVAMHLAKTGLRRAAELKALLGRRAGGTDRDTAHHGASVDREVTIGTSPGLSWSDRGRHAFGPAAAAAIPDTTPGGRTTLPYVYTMVTPGTSGIGVNVNWVDGRPGVLISFGASPLDDGAIDGVMRCLRGGVAGVLGPRVPAA